MQKGTTWSRRVAWNARNVLNLLLYLFVILFVVGFSFPAWSYFESPYFSRYAGLWRCPSGSSCTLYTSGQPIATQSMECIALSADILACGAVLLFYYCLYLERYSNQASLVSMIEGTLAITGGLFGIIGCIVYTVYVHDNTQDALGWAFIITLIASIFISIVGCGLVILSTPAFKNFFIRKYETILGS